MSEARFAEGTNASRVWGRRRVMAVRQRQGTDGRKLTAERPNGSLLVPKRMLDCGPKRPRFGLTRAYSWGSSKPGSDKPGPLISHPNKPPLKHLAVRLGRVASCNYERLLRGPEGEDRRGRRARYAQSRGCPRLLKLGVSSVKRYVAAAREGRSLAPKRRPGSKPELDERARLLEADPEERSFLRGGSSWSGRPGCG
jgi:hypothetical protein